MKILQLSWIILNIIAINVCLYKTKLFLQKFSGRLLNLVKVEYYNLTNYHCYVNVYFELLLCFKMFLCYWFFPILSYCSSWDELSTGIIVWWYAYVLEVGPDCLEMSDVLPLFSVLDILSVAGTLKRKTLVLDLDETLIHSHHDGVLRQTVKPGTPPDFVLKVDVKQRW